jgi:hypothetical protein
MGELLRYDIVGYLALIFSVLAIFFGRRLQVVD